MRNLKFQCRSSVTPITALSGLEGSYGTPKRARPTGEEYQSIYGGEAVYRDGKVISRLRSGGYGFTVQRNIGYAYLPLELAKPGTRLEIEVFDTRLPAQMTANVLVDPKGEKLRA